MQKSPLQTLCVGLLLSTALIGCGDKKIRTGIFIDSAVGNISYSTDSIAGRTDSGGQFSYRKGETIEFFLGDLSLGQGNADESMSPLDLVPDSTINTASIINRAILLQSLDLDSDTSNGIAIPELSYSLSAAAINFNQSVEAFSGDGNTLAYVRAAKSDATATLVLAATAKTHLAQSIGAAIATQTPSVSAQASAVVAQANDEIILTGVINSLITSFSWAVEDNSDIILTLGADSPTLSQLQASFIAPAVTEVTNYTFRFVGEDSSNISYTSQVVVQVNPVSSL